MPTPTRLILFLLPFVTSRITPDTAAAEPFPTWSPTCAKDRPHLQEADPSAQPPSDSTPASDQRESRRRAERAWLDAVATGDAARIEAAIRAFCEADESNFVPWYNLAAFLSSRNRLDDAGPALERAIESGFVDFFEMDRDPALAPLRATPRYAAIRDAWAALQDARIDANLEHARSVFGPSYQYVKDESLRVAFVCGSDAATLDRARNELTHLAQWWANEVLPPSAPSRPPTSPPTTTPSQPSTHPTESTLDTPRSPRTHTDPWVLVILPTRLDYNKWAIATFGSRFQSVAGSYSDDAKTLTAMDLGATARHEFLHALHWRHMHRIGQRHPAWVMEGLCSLAEDVRPDDDRIYIPEPSWRTNTAKRMGRVGNLVAWPDFFHLSLERFNSVRTLGNYAQARAMFLFLWDKRLLRDWYDALIRNFSDDPLGSLAWETAFGSSLKATESEFRVWLRLLPEIPEEILAGGADLPFRVEATAADGLEITSAVGTTDAGRAGLRMGDVITAINANPVRDRSELVRLLRDMSPEQDVELSYRRGSRTGSATIRLIAHPGG